jgi:asparaginyl-tRNA synthetase
MRYIKDLKSAEGTEITLKGWVANKRTGKGLVFIILRDGSGICQCVVTENTIDQDQFNQADKLTLESSVEITGMVVKDDRQEGGYEIQVSHIHVYQVAEEYPIAKKAHGIEFLMDNRHLWLRSRRQWAIMKIRNSIIFAIHEFFQQEGFVQMDAPIFTGNACEGTTNLFETEFYDMPAYLSQSGQLYGEAMAMAMGKIYTFGPTFRAEKSKTRRHLSEFWMIEPEMAFYDLDQNMDLIESFLKFVVGKVLTQCEVELAVIERDTTVLKNIVQTFPRIPYADAVKMIKGELDVNGKNSIITLEEDLAKVSARIDEINAEIVDRETKIATPGLKKGEVNFHVSKVASLREELKDCEENQKNIPQWLQSARNFKDGEDFGGSDETVLTRLFDTPIMVYDWPHEVKAFYLKRSNDSRYAKGVDVLAPEGYGEIVGGGERDTDKDLLISKIKEHDLPMEAFEWYLDLRRYGSVPHAGFGLGLERLVAWVCKLPHVRESIPFPRMYGRLLP